MDAPMPRNLGTGIVGHRLNIAYSTRRAGFEYHWLEYLGTYYCHWGLEEIRQNHIRKSATGVEQLSGVLLFAGPLLPRGYRANAFVGSLSQPIPA